MAVLSDTLRVLQKIDLFSAKQKMWKKCWLCFPPPPLSRAHEILSIQLGRQMIPPVKSCQMTPPCCTRTFPFPDLYGLSHRLPLLLTAKGEGCFCLEKKAGGLFVQRWNPVFVHLSLKSKFLSLGGFCMQPILQALHPGKSWHFDTKLIFPG